MKNIQKVPSSCKFTQMERTSVPNSKKKRIRKNKQEQKTSEGYKVQFNKNILIGAIWGAIIAYSKTPVTTILGIAIIIILSIDIED